MYTALVSIALGSAALWSTAEACQYSEHPDSVLYGNDAVRVPIEAIGAPAQNECAATAQAFGLTTASIVPGEEGAGSECVVFGAATNSTACITYEALAGAITLSNITECDSANVQAVTDAAVELTGGVAASVGTGSSALKLTDTAAVGMAVHSDLSVVSEEECLVACSTYISGCTHVTSVIEQGMMVKCSFHGSPTQGVTVTGASTYSDIVASPTLASRTLDGQAVAAAPATVAAVEPVAAPIAPLEAPTVPLEAPPAVAPVAAPISAPVAAPEAAIVPEAGEEALAPVAGQPMGAIEELVYSPPGTCPSQVITDVPAGKHEDSLEPPEVVIDTYTDVLGDDGKFAMPYDEIVNGGSYCVAKGSTETQVIMGGMFFWEMDGECVTPPVNDAGESCCSVFMWQPNTAGFYYENCSMMMKIQPDGLYHFITEMPGDESINEWGPDPEPHIHFDIECSGCSAHGVVAGDYKYWNKFYPEGLCTIDGCGTQGPEHQATELSAGGQVVYKYDFILPADTRTQNRKRLAV